MVHCRYELLVKHSSYYLLKSEYMESQPQNPEFRNILTTFTHVTVGSTAAWKQCVS